LESCYSSVEENAMQLLALPLAALTLLGATNVPPSPSVAGPEATLGAVKPVTPSDAQCRDRITLARKAAGKPPLLEREPASPDKPYLIYAVDRRQDGCAVMVMKGDPADIRSLPARPEGVVRMVPLGRIR
jgi:hypothetical protein